MGRAVRRLQRKCYCNRTRDPGPAEFLPLDEPTARMTLAELQLVQ
jgi:hypothetical protein